MIPGLGTRSHTHATAKSPHAAAKHAATKIPCAATKTQRSQNKYITKYFLNKMSLFCFGHKFKMCSQYLRHSLGLCCVADRHDFHLLILGVFVFSWLAPSVRLGVPNSVPTCGLQVCGGDEPSQPWSSWRLVTASSLTQSVYPSCHINITVYRDVCHDVKKSGKH